MEFEIFKKYPELEYGFSTKSDGSMNRHSEIENRERYFLSKGIDPSRVVSADLVHGVNVVLADDKMAGALLPDTDALVTSEKNLFISVTGADCFPLYLYSPDAKAIAIAHIGWRGLLGGIVKNVIEGMARDFKSEPGSILVGIGSGIRECHFEISAKDKNLYEKYSRHVVDREGKVYVNLPGIIKEELINSGLKEENIEDSGLCTYCLKDEYFSYRRDRSEVINSMVAYIGLKD